MPRSCLIALGSREYTVAELPRKHNRAWLHMISEPAKRLGEQIGNLGDLDIKEWADLRDIGGQMISDLMALIDTDNMLDLLCQYAPEIGTEREQIEDDDELYDSQIVQAFVGVLGIASPFGTITQLFQKLASGGSNKKTSKKLL